MGRHCYAAMHMCGVIIPECETRFQRVQAIGFAWTIQAQLQRSYGVALFFFFIDNFDSCTFVFLGMDPTLILYTVFYCCFFRNIE